MVIAIPLTQLAVAADAQFQIGGVALGGFDPVSYFRMQRAERGNPDYRHRYNDTTWYFTSELHRDLFAEDPQQYTPQYGGFCAYALSQGKLVPVDPHAWTVHAGKLYLNYSTRVRDAWRADIEGHLERAAAHWDQLRNFNLPLDAQSE